MRPQSWVEKGEGGWVGGFSCAVAGEAICLEEPGYLPSQVPTFPPPEPLLPPSYRQVPVYPNALQKTFAQVSCANLLLA